MKTQIDKILQRKSATEISSEIELLKNACKERFDIELCNIALNETLVLSLQRLNNHLAAMSITQSARYEAWLSENNPCYYSEYLGE